MLHIGWSTRTFTPERPAMIQGQKRRRIGSEALDPLTVTAMAVEGGNPKDCAILISCDLAYISDGLWSGVRAHLAGSAPEVPAEKVVLNGTHTHTSLVFEDGFYVRPDDAAVMTPPECEAWVAERAAEAAAEAWHSRAPRLIGRAFGHAVVGHNRYASYADGHSQMYGQTNREDFNCIGGYQDHSLDMIFVWEPSGELTGVALAIPCPSQVDEGLEVFSADYWHEVRVELRRRFGRALQVLPLCSAAGDQSPHFLVYAREEAEMRRRCGLSEREEIARRVGDAVERALVCTHAEAQEAMPFAHAVHDVQLTPYKVSQAEREWAEAEYKRCVERGETESWWPQGLKGVIETADGVRKQQPFETELHVLRVGEVVLATNPFELFLDYGLQIKARSAAAQTVLVQLAGRGWYLPTRRATECGGYGAMPVVCAVGPEGGAELVEKTLEAVRALFPESSQ